MIVEFTTTVVNSGGQVATNTSIVSDWLLRPAVDKDYMGSKERAKEIYQIAISAMDARLGHVSNDDLHPENRQVINCAWVND